jgi:hypothetical protein
VHDRGRQNRFIQDREKYSHKELFFVLAEIRCDTTEDDRRVLPGYRFSLGPDCPQRAKYISMLCLQ